jgi:transcriptional regulator with XRE-family HTH domain
MTRPIYPSYLFKTHDPVLDAIDTLIEDAGVSYTYIANKSGVTQKTLLNWHRRKTRRPQYATIAAVVRALGGTITIT